MQRDTTTTTGVPGADSATSSPAVAPLLPIFDRVAKANKMVNADDYEVERTQLGRLLRFLQKEIPADAKEVLEGYPFESVKDMYSEVMESLQHAANYYSKGDLLLSGRWAQEAKRYTDIEMKAHKLLMEESALSYVGKRVGLAVIGFFEGAADALLGLIDMGAALVGQHPGLVEWNTKRYEQIKGGYSSLSGVDHTLVHDDEIGRFGGKVAGGLAIGSGIAKAAQGGSTAAQLLMFAQVGGGIRSTVDSISAMREKGRTWGDIFSDPATIAQIAGNIAGVAGIGSATIPALKDFLTQAGLIATSAQLSAMTATVIKIQNDTSLTDEQRYQQFLDATANLLVAAGLAADQYGVGKAVTEPALAGTRTGGAEPATTTEPATTATNSVHEKFDLSDVTPPGAEVAPTKTGGRIGAETPENPTGTDEHVTTTKPAPEDPAAIADIGDDLAEPPVPERPTPEQQRPGVHDQFDVSDVDPHTEQHPAGPKPAATPPQPKPLNTQTATSAAEAAEAAAKTAVDLAQAADAAARAAEQNGAGEPAATMRRASDTAKATQARATRHAAEARKAADEAGAAAQRGDAAAEMSAARLARYHASQARAAAQDAARLAVAAKIAGVNPSGAMDNCGHVIEAVEARLNGTNPDAVGRQAGNLYLHTKSQKGGIRHEESVGEQYDGSFDPSSEAEIAGDLAARGDGAQGVVSVDWINSDGSTGEIGHVFNAVRQNGFDFFVDGQTENVRPTIGDLFPGARIAAIRYMPIRR